MENTDVYFHMDPFVIVDRLFLSHLDRGFASAVYLYYLPPIYAYILSVYSIL